MTMNKYSPFGQPHCMSPSNPHGNSR